MPQSLKIAARNEDVAIDETEPIRLCCLCTCVSQSARSRGPGCDHIKAELTCKISDTVRALLVHDYDPYEPVNRTLAKQSLEHRPREGDAIMNWNDDANEAFCLHEES